MTGCHQHQRAAGESSGRSSLEIIAEGEYWAIAGGITEYDIREEAGRSQSIFSD